MVPEPEKSSGVCCSLAVLKSLKQNKVFKLGQKEKLIHFSFCPSLKTVNLPGKWKNCEIKMTLLDPSAEFGCNIFKN